MKIIMTFKFEIEIDIKIYKLTKCIDSQRNV